MPPTRVYQPRHRPRGVARHEHGGDRAALALVGVFAVEGWLLTFLPRVDPSVLRVQLAPLPALDAVLLVVLGAGMGLLGAFLSLVRSREN